jgi:Fe-S cluster biogenesis protein NfuA
MTTEYLLDNDSLAFNEDVECDASDIDIVNSIKEFLDEVIRPQIAMDGGDLQLKAYKNQVAYLQLRGSMLPSYNFIRETLVANIPDLIDIEQV